MIAKKIMWTILFCLGGLSVLVACGSAEPTTPPEPPTAEAPIVEQPVVNFLVPNPTPMPLPTGSATEVTAQVLGSSVIYLAGRSDLQIPPAGEALPEGFDPSCRGVVLETRPVGWQIAPESSFTFQATGEVDFFGGEASSPTRPDGQESFSGVVSLGGISGYEGPNASLVGLFLDDQPPTGSAPTALKYIGEEATLSLSEPSYTPALGQLFFIGDGLTGFETGETQTFVAPAGATRLYLGFADGFGFVGAPGCYGDNSGAFMVKINGSQPFSPLVNGQ